MISNEYTYSKYLKYNPVFTLTPYLGIANIITDGLT
jgi:hypothetical protein